MRDIRLTTALIVAVPLLAAGGTPRSLAADPDAGATFAQGPGMSGPRMGHACAALPDGRVAVFGGHGPGWIARADAEVLDPVTQSWSAIAMSAPHDDAAFARLADGRRLIAGGAADLGAGSASIDSEVYDPASDSLTPTGGLNIARSACGAARLASGMVLVVGGARSPLASAFAELFDPSVGGYVLTAPLAHPCSSPLVLPCADGTALVAGGVSPEGAALERIESFDPQTVRFAAVAPMLFTGEIGWNPVVAVSDDLDAHLLPDGRYLLLAARWTGTMTEQRLFTFDPQTKAIERFATSAALPSAESARLSPPLVDAARGAAHLVALVPGASSASASVWSVRLADGLLVAPDAAHALPAGYDPARAALALGADGRIVVTGGTSLAGADADLGAVDSVWLLTPRGVPPVLGDPPSAPARLAVAPAGPDVLLLTWDDASDDERGFAIERDDGAGFVAVGTVGADVVSFSDTGVPPATTCRYRVRAWNDAGESADSDVAAAEIPAGRAKVTRRRIEFGARQVGRTAIRSVTIRNARRDVPLWVDADLAGAENGFAVLSGGRATRIPPRGRLVVQVSFGPSARGPAAATLDVRTSDPDRTDAMVRLSGRGR